MPSASLHSKLSPPHPKHELDLAERDVPVREATTLAGDLNFITDTVLEVSREVYRTRGGLMLLGVLCLLFVGAGALMVTSELSAFIRDVPVLTFLLFTVLAGLLFTASMGLRLDLKLPRDEPIRFNRKTGKVYVNGIHDFTWPWERLVHSVRIFDWDTLQAEQLRYLASNGRFLVMRYGIDLVVCKPGGYEVVDRFWLVRNALALNTFSFGPKWAFIRAYMQGADVDALASGDQRHSEQPSLRTSLIRHLPYLDFSEAGRSWANSASGCFFMALILIATPLILPLALAHYVALRLAPPVAWPPEIDTASRAAA